MTAILIIGSIICCWAMLRVIGGERERRVREVDYEIARQAAIERRRAEEAAAIAAAAAAEQAKAGRR